MDKPFKFLRDAEWETLKRSAEHRRFEPGATILAAGDKPSGIMVVEQGTINVVRDSGVGFALTVAELGPGSITGEMSFIEAVPADVGLVADDDVAVLYITHAQVKAIILDNPAFYGRFFQSLAFLLSRRLRETTSRIGKQAGGDEWIAND